MSLIKNVLGLKSRKDPTLQFLNRLRELGVAPLHIVDIGANRGDWTRRAMQIFPESRFTMFEPQKSLASSHRDLSDHSSIKIEYAGLGKIDGTSAFTLHARDDSSSFSYSIEQAKSQGFSQIEIPIFRLDTYMKRSSFGQPGIVKIDAEGLDLDVIEGATETLLLADVVLVEAAVSNSIYPNTVVEVIKTMDDIGYKLFDITDLNRTPKRRVLWLVELAFIQKNSDLAKKASHYQ